LFYIVQVLTDFSLRMSLHVFLMIAVTLLGRLLGSDFTIALHFFAGFERIMSSWGRALMRSCFS